MRSGFGKDVPKSQGFITGTSDNCFTVGTHGQVENAVMMTRQFSDLKLPIVVTPTFNKLSEQFKLPAPNWDISRLKSDSVSIRELKLILMSVWTRLNCTLGFQYRPIALPIR